MIPKIIHYCWFGRNPKPKLAEKCIASWKKFCPDYEIIEWNEKNFDVQQHPYLEWCYENKKWAFLSDFARLLIVEQYGGIYFDTDVELLRSPDELLAYEAFYGFENKDHVATGLGFGAVAGHETVAAMIQQYTDIKQNLDGSYPLIVCPALNTQALMKFGLVLNGQRQNLKGTEILPVDVLNPYNDITGQFNKTSDTVSVHWYSKSWMSKKVILKSKLTKPLHRLFGTNCFRWIKSR